MTHKAILALAVAVLAVALVNPAEAKHRPHKAVHAGPAVAARCVYDNSGHMTCAEPEKRIHTSRIASDGNGNRADPRPRAWCGWQLRQWLGVADRAYNLARNWAHFGSRASGPAPGVIAVYPHHVGIVVSVPGPGRMVMKSGNDGHAVRTRERSTRGVIAWRLPPQRYAGL